jgi:hypothetical protein
MKLIRNPQLSARRAGHGRGERQSAPQNDSISYFPCLRGPFEHYLFSVCQAIQVLRLMKLALDEARYTYPLFISGPGAVQR